MSDEKLKAWSYSTLSDYRNCPRKVYYAKIEKVKVEQEENEAAERGTRIHAEGEAFLNGEIDKVPESFKRLGDELEKLRNQGALAEQEWAMTENFGRFVNWFSPKAWVRAKVDALVEIEGGLRVIDFKTGKKRWEPYRAGDLCHQDQVELYAAIASYLHPDAEFIDVEAWYLDLEDTEQESNLEVEVIEPDAYRRIQRRWAREPRIMLNDTTWKTKPNPLCGWCPFSHYVGGPCEKAARKPPAKK